MLWLGGRRERLLADKELLGRWGEKRCEGFLRRKGYATIARRFACKGGEADLVMGDRDGAMIFVEVKTRRDEEYADAQAAVGRTKQKRIAIAAKTFLKKYRVKDKAVRFDVVAVVLGDKGRPEIRHYENAFVP